MMCPETGLKILRSAYLNLVGPEAFTRMINDEEKLEDLMHHGMVLNTHWLTFPILFP